MKNAEEKEQEHGKNVGGGGHDKVEVETREGTLSCGLEEIDW